MSYYYAILFCAIIVPFLFSFHPKVEFYKKFNILLISIPLSSIPFIIWDIVFTRLGVWGFNKEFVSGIYIFNLPIEEILFFVIVPFCCIYSFHLVEKFKISFFKRILNWEIINAIWFFMLVCIAILNHSNKYSFFCFIFCSLVILIRYYYKINISDSYFYTTFILIILPFIIVNGALTGMFHNKIIVWYNQAEILGLYLFTIPIEDIIYSYQLILFNLIIYKKLVTIA